MDQNFIEAYQLAKMRDVEREKAREANLALPLIHGIPFSVKDHILLKNCSSTWGKISQIYPLDKETNSIIKVLMQCGGAIPFLKSSVPQFPSLITDNSISGFARNPFNLQRSSGGSSGGEGGLIASLCSPFGIGSDMAGSLRVPSAWCGLATICPGPQRVPLGENVGIARSAAGGALSFGESSIFSTLGPMGKSVNDVIAIMEVLCSQQSFKRIPHQIPMPISSNRVIQLRQKKLKIGFYYDDGYFQSTQAVIRAVNIAKQILQQKGHQLIQIKIPRFNQYSQLMMKLMILDQFKSFAEGFKPSEPLTKISKQIIKFSQLPEFVLSLIKTLLKIKGENRLVVLSQSKSNEIIDSLIQLKDMREQIIEYLQNKNVDAILSPVNQVPAPRQSDLKENVPTSLTGIYNLLRMPSGVVSVSRVNQHDQLEELRQVYKINDTISKGIKKTIVGANGLPLGAQIASFIGRQELILALLLDIEEGVKEKDLTNQQAFDQMIADRFPIQFKD